MTEKLHVLVIDDHELFRAGLKHLLRDVGSEIVFHQAEHVNAALATTFTHLPELILLDYHLPFLEGVEALHAIKNHFPSSTVVILSGDQNALVIREAIDNGAAGYIPKTISHAAFLAALKLVTAGEVYIPKQALTDLALIESAGLVEPTIAPSEAESAVNSLTNRRKGALLLAIKGFSNKEIARRMSISEGTVKAHLSSAFKLLNVRNRTEAVLRFAELNTKDDE